MKYLFGPVNSRRLGISLGIDLLPYKTCSLDCAYCECGGTTVHTSEPGEYVPTAAVIRELDEYLSKGPALDIVTFSGSGEPTLHSGIGAIITHLKTRYPRYNVAVITNSTQLWRPEVREALAQADIVMPSLDAVSPQVFNTILRPCPGITPQLIINGLRDFRASYKGKLILEIFIIPGLNDTPDELAKFRETCLSLKPDLIQLNSLDRPGAEKWVTAASPERLMEILAYLRPLPVDIIAKKRETTAPASGNAGLSEKILATLERRPSTLTDLTIALGYNSSEIIKEIESLIKGNYVTTEWVTDREFYIRKK